MQTVFVAQVMTYTIWTLHMDIQRVYVSQNLCKWKSSWLDTTKFFFYNDPTQALWIWTSPVQAMSICKDEPAGGRGRVEQVNFIIGRCILLFEFCGNVFAVLVCNILICFHPCWLFRLEVNVLHAVMSSLSCSRCSEVTVSTDFPADTVTQTGDNLKEHEGSRQVLGQHMLPERGLMCLGNDCTSVRLYWRDEHLSSNKRYHLLMVVVKSN